MIPKELQARKTKKGEETFNFLKREKSKKIKNKEKDKKPRNPRVKIKSKKAQDPL